MFLVIETPEGNPVSVTNYDTEAEAVEAFENIELTKWCQEVHLVDLSKSSESKRMRVWAESDLDEEQDIHLY